MTSPFLTVLSFGAGQDSTYILYKLVKEKAYRAKWAPQNLLVVMSDTGNEHTFTYEHVKYCASLCEEFKIPFYFLGDEWRSKSWKGGLRGHYERYHVVMSKVMNNKSCTDQLKIRPIYKFLSVYVNDQFLNGMFRPENKQSLKVFAERYGKIRVLIGISKEEATRRIATMESELSLPVYMKACIDKVYPLVEEGLSRKDCQQGINIMKMPVPYPSNCIWCPFLSKMELIWLSRNLPQDFEALKVRENAKKLKFAHKPKNYGVFGSKSIEQVLQEAILEYGHLSDAELNDHKFSHGHCVGSRY